MTGEEEPLKVRNCAANYSVENGRIEMPSKYIPVKKKPIENNVLAYCSNRVRCICQHCGSVTYTAGAGACPCRVCGARVIVKDDLVGGANVYVSAIDGRGNVSPFIQGYEIGR